MKFPNMVPESQGFKTDAEVKADLILHDMEQRRGNCLLREMHGREYAKLHMAAMKFALEKAYPRN